MDLTSAKPVRLRPNALYVSLTVLLNEHTRWALLITNNFGKITRYQWTDVPRAEASFHQDLADKRFAYSEDGQLYKTLEGYAADARDLYLAMHFRVDSPVVACTHTPTSTVLVYIQILGFQHRPLCNYAAIFRAFTRRLEEDRVRNDHCWSQDISRRAQRFIILALDTLAGGGHIISAQPIPIGLHFEKFANRLHKSLGDKFFFSKEYEYAYLTTF